LSYSKAWIHRVKEMEMLKKFVTGVLMRERMGVDGIGHGDDGGIDEMDPQKRILIIVVFGIQLLAAY
jgi:hypothetical protein